MTGGQLLIILKLDGCGEGRDERERSSELTEFDGKKMRHDRHLK